MTRSPGSSVRCYLLLSLPLAFGACAGSSPEVVQAPSEAADPAGAPPVITSREQLEAHVDRLVTLEGTVTETKIPTILGVDVDADELGRRCRATGILRKQVLCAERRARRRAFGPATRGGRTG